MNNFKKRLMEVFELYARAQFPENAWENLK